MDIFLNFLSLAGSLGLFLYGMKTMSEGLEKLADYILNVVQTKARQTRV